MVDLYLTKYVYYLYNIKEVINMATLDRNSYNDLIKKLVGDRSDDEALKAVEDLSDTYDSFGEDWKKKYEDNDKEWREKYKSRFLEPTEEKEDEDTTETKDETNLTIDDLFEEVK